MQYYYVQKQAEIGTISPLFVTLCDSLWVEQKIFHELVRSCGARCYFIAFFSLGENDLSNISPAESSETPSPKPEQEDIGT